MNYQERIKHCIELIKTLDPNTVDLVDWQHPCGATRCVVGHLCATPEAQREGLGLAVEGDEAYPVFNSYFAERTGWQAVAKYFGIQSDEAMYIFALEDSEDTTIDDVRKKLEEFVK